MKLALQTILEDFYHALRVLQTRPAFSLVVLMTLAVGIGANTAIFSVIRAVLLRPLPFKQPDRLMTVWERDPKRGYDQNLTSPGNFEDWRNLNEAFESLATYDTLLKQWFNLTGSADPERVAGAAVSANLFDVLGIHPLLGRSFSPEEEQVGRDRVVIISHGLWQRRFGGDPAVIGKAISLDEVNYVVVGIMSPGFRFPGMTGVLFGFFYNKPADLWVPLAMENKAWRQRSNHYLQVVARLKPGISVKNAEAEMCAIQQRLVEQYPAEFMGSYVKILPLHDQSVANVRTGLLVLFASAGLVLLIACGNVANLFLTRSVARQKELAIRVALGASRRDLIQHLLAESTVLGVGGGLLGLLFAIWGLKYMLAQAGGDLGVATHGWGDIRFDTQVFGFTALCSVFTGVLFGLAPAIQCTNPDINHTLKDAGRNLGSRGQHRVLKSLVVSQTALAMTLLCGAGLLVQGFLRLQRVEPGFNPKNLLTMEISLLKLKYRNPYRQTTFYEQIVERVKALPGIQAVGVVTQLPLSGENVNQPFEIIGRPPPTPGTQETTDYRAISASYFDAMQIPLKRGRGFTLNDNTNTPIVAVISESFANRYFANQDPIGARLKMLDRSIEIIGVSGEVRNRALDKVFPHIYFSHSQVPFWSTMTLIVRTSLNPLASTAAVIKEVRTVDKDQPISKVTTMEGNIQKALVQQRFRTLLLFLFAVTAMVLALIGIFGVMAYVTSQRTREFGVRAALGAKGRELLIMVMGQGIALAGFGIVLGSGAAVIVLHLISRLVFEFSLRDSMTFIMGVALMLTSAALLACYFPARRAAKINPVVALRHE